MKRALLDAAATLFASRGASAVSVRDIAAQAEVNHGLVHRHFGSKEKLRRAVMSDLTQSLAGETEGEIDVETLTSPAMDAYWRMLARALLDGDDIEQLQASFPVVSRLLGQIERGQEEGALRADVDARHLAALGIAAGLGWLLFGPFVVASLGLSKRGLTAKLLEAWLSLTRAP